MNKNIIALPLVTLFLYIVFYFYINKNTSDITLKNNFLYLSDGSKLSDEEILDFKIYDIDNDLSDEIIVLTKKDTTIYGKDIVVYKFFEEIYREDFSNVNPWKIDICNLDNDGDIDFFMGVYKDTKYYKDIRNRPFFYSWDGEKLYKKWTGSFFTELDLIDVAFGDYMQMGFEQVAVLEKNKDNLYRVGLYSWIGFGFQKLAESDYYDNIKSISSKEIDGTKYINLTSKYKDVILSKSNDKVHDYIKLSEFKRGVQ